MSGAGRGGRAGRLLEGVRCLAAFAILAFLTGVILHAGAGSRAASVGRGMPYLAYDAATRIVSYDTVDSTANAVVCVAGDATGGTETLFTYNSHGFGSATATFQTDTGGANTNVYRLYKGAVFAGGLPTKGACATGTFVTSMTVTT